MMTAEQHIPLLNALLDHKGPVILSGYDNQLYNDTLAGWRKETHYGRSNSGSSRQEVLWLNFNEHQQSFFK